MYHIFENFRLDNNNIEHIIFQIMFDLFQIIITNFLFIIY